MTTPVFGYWGIRGFGQPCRLLLHYLGVNFEDKTYDVKVGEDGNLVGRDKWFVEDKNNLGLDFPNLPYWIEGDVKITQSNAIMRHLARERDPSLMASNNEEERQIDMLQGDIWDLVQLLTKCLYIRTDDLVEDYDNNAPERISRLSKFLGDKKWFLGDQLKYVDFLIYEFLCHQKAYKPEILSFFPNLEKYLTNFEAIPAIDNYMKSGAFENYPKFYTLMAKYQI